MRKRRKRVLIELVGGPHDGCEIEVDDDVMFIRFPCPGEPVFCMDADAHIRLPYDVEPPVRFACDVYERRTRWWRRGLKADWIRREGSVLP